MDRNLLQSRQRCMDARRPEHHDPRCAWCAFLSSAQARPCRSGHVDCTVDCGWCKGTGVEFRQVPR